MNQDQFILSEKMKASLYPILVSRGYRPISDIDRTPEEVRNIVYHLLKLTKTETIEDLNDWLDEHAAKDCWEAARKG